MSKNLVSLTVDGSSYTARPYGTCTTEAATAAKVVTCADFVLATSATILVYFKNANTASSPTLNVNGTGAKNIFYRDAALASSLYYWGAGDTVEFLYDGTQWKLLNVSNANDNTKNTTGSTNSSSKLFLVGATTQGANPTTYSHDTAYVGTDGCLYSGSKKVLTSFTETTLSKGTDSTAASTLSHSGKFTAITGFAVNNHQITPTVTTYTLPSDNNTDTKNTTGSTDSSAKLFLVGATTQGANPVTYSHDTAYVGTDGCLYSNGTKVSVAGHTHDYAPASHTHSQYLTAHQSVTNSAPTLSWGTTSTVGTVGGTALTVKMPSNPNSDTNTAHSHTAGTGLEVSGSGGTSGSVSYSLKASGVTAGTYGPSADVTGAHNATISVPQITVDTYGRVTSAANKTYTSVNTDTNTDTDTKTTAGASNSSSKLFLVGATTQGTSPTTYTHDTAYVGTDGCLYSNSTKVSVEGHTHSGYLTSHQSVTANNPTLAWGTTSTIGTIGSTALKVTMPANPDKNTDTKNTVGATTKSTGGSLHRLVIVATGSSTYAQSYISSSCGVMDDYLYSGGTRVATANEVLGITSRCGGSVSDYNEYMLLVQLEALDIGYYDLKKAISGTAVDNLNPSTKIHIPPMSNVGVTSYGSITMAMNGVIDYDEGAHLTNGFVSGAISIYCDKDWWIDYPSTATGYFTITAFNSSGTYVGTYATKELSVDIRYIAATSIYNSADQSK